MYKYTTLVAGFLMLALSHTLVAEENTASSDIPKDDFYTDHAYFSRALTAPRWETPFKNDFHFMQAPPQRFNIEGMPGGFIPPTYPARPMAPGFSGPAPFIQPMRRPPLPPMSPPQMAMPAPQNQAQINFLMGQLQDMELQLQLLTQENARLKMKQQAESMPLSQEHLVQLSLTQASLAALTAERDQLLLQLEAIQAQQQQTQSNLTQTQGKLETFQKEKKNAEQNRAQHDQRLQQLEAEKAQLEATLEQERGNRTYALEQAQAGLSDMENSFLGERQTLQTEIAGLKEQLQQLQSNHGQLQDAYSALKMEGGDQSRAVEEARAHMADMENDYGAERQALTDEIANMKQQLQQSQASHQELIQAYDHLKQEHGGQSSAIEQVKARSADIEVGFSEAKLAMQTEITGLQQQLEQLGQQSTAQQTDMEDSFTAERQALTDEIANLKQQIQQSQGSHQELLQAYDNMKQEHGSQSSSLQQAEARSADMEAGFNEVKLAMQAEITSLQQQLEQLGQASSAQQSELTETRNQLAEGQSCNNELSEIKQTLANRSDEIGALNMRLTNTDSMMTGLKAASKNARDRLASMAVEYQSMQEALENSKVQLAKIDPLIQTKDREIAELQSQLEAQQSEQRGLSQQLEANMQSTKEQDNLTASLQTELALLKTDLDNRAQSLQQAEAAMQKQAGQLKQLEQTSNAFNRCQADLSQSSQEITRLEETLNSLRSELESSQAAQADLEKMTSDTDGDGISDAMDICPDTTRGVNVNSKGCEPDADLDGLVDRLDLCSGTADGASIDEVGCSSEQTITLEGVNFQSGSADFTTESLAVLDTVAVILKQFDNLSVEVAGHTDNTGSRELNIDLSATRATAVKTYLVEQGISSERLSAYGYGPDQPVASNASSAGRALNRRVELRRK